MEKTVVNQIESKFKSMSFLKLMMLSFVTGGIGALFFVFTKDILNIL